VETFSCTQTHIAFVCLFLLFFWSLKAPGHHSLSVQHNAASVFCYCAPQKKERHTSLKQHGGE